MIDWDRGRINPWFSVKYIVTNKNFLGLQVLQVEPNLKIEDVKKKYRKVGVLDQGQFFIKKKPNVL